MYIYNIQDAIEGTNGRGGRWQHLPSNTYTPPSSNQGREKKEGHVGRWHAGNAGQNPSKPQCVMRILCFFVFVLCRTILKGREGQNGAGHSIVPLPTLLPGQLYSDSPFLFVGVFFLVT